MAYKRKIIEKIPDDALLGFIRGTEAVHSLPSYLATLPEQRDSDRKVGRTKSNKIPYKIIESLTIAGEITAYVYAASNGLEDVWRIPLIMNTFDVCGYLVLKRDEIELKKPREKIHLKGRAFWERVLDGLYVPSL
jgi:hypothetical protein